ncbi:MAG TPA: EamA family transporter [Candidatus Eisenbacteria bacterium]|nr:EamA family transporter [Candidatus Eisenbacteria bacterium]
MNAATNPPASAKTAYVLLAFACIYLVWGSTYLAIRFAIDTIPPFLMVGVRFMLAGALLYAWVAWRGGVTRPTAADWRSATIYGGCFFLMGNGGVSWAETRISSGIAALLVAMSPLWMTLMETYLRGWSKPTRLGTVGLVLGFLGVAFLVGPGESLTKAAVDPLSAVVMVFSTLGWAYGTVFAKDGSHPPSLLQTAAMQMFCGGVLALLLGTGLGEWRDFHAGAISMKSMLAFLYLVIFGSIVAFSAFAYLLRVTRPTRVATYAFVNPVVAVFLGWALGGEVVTARTLIAGGVAVTGVILILRSRARAAAASAR